jgi:hypothetical protein
MGQQEVIWRTLQHCFLLGLTALQQLVPFIVRLLNKPGNKNKQQKQMQQRKLE